MRFAVRSGPSQSTVDGIQIHNHSDLDEALANSPKIAVIANPTALHVPVAIAAAQRGCHLFLEKPVSNSLAGVDRLTDEVQKQNLQ